MTDLATFVTREVKGVRVVEAQGEFDLGNVGDLRTTIKTALDGTDVVIISLERVSYMDSSALAVLIQASQQAGTQRRKLLIIAPRVTPAGKLIRIAAIDQVAPVFETVDDAIATLAA
jgi:anti-anti-sigma factor